MTGSAFVVFDGGWACSNMATFRETSQPIRLEDGTIQSLQIGYQLTIEHLFAPNIPVEQDLNCEIVFKDDDKSDMRGFIGKVQRIGEQHTFIKIFTKTDRIPEILRKIT
jgi:hypothetical protein